MIESLRLGFWPVVIILSLWVSPYLVYCMCRAYEDMKPDLRLYFFTPFWWFMSEPFGEDGNRYRKRGLLVGYGWLAILIVAYNIIEPGAAPPLFMDKAPDGL